METRRYCICARSSVVRWPHELHHRNVVESFEGRGATSKECEDAVCSRTFRAGYVCACADAPVPKKTDDLHDNVNPGLS